MVTVNEALDAFLIQLAADGRSRHSIAQVRRHVLLLARWLAAQSASDDIATITPDSIARFLSAPIAREAHDGRTKRASSMNALRTSIRCYGRFLHDAGLVSANPARLVRRARCGVPLPKPVTEAEVERMRELMAAERTVAARRDLALLSLLAGTGARIGSAVAAQVEDLDLERGVLSLRTTKGDRPSRVFVPRTLACVLREYLGARTTGPLFPAAHGGRMSTRSAASRLQLWARRAGIQGAVSPHRVRHFFGTQLLAKTGNLELVRRAMTHKSIASTVIYLEVADSTLREALEA